MTDHTSIELAAIAAIARGVGANAIADDAEALRGESGAPLVELIERAKRYLREHRRALATRHDLAARRGEQLSAWALVFDEAVALALAGTRGQRERLAATLATEQVKLAMASKADLAAAIVAVVEAQPRPDLAHSARAARYLATCTVDAWRLGIATSAAAATRAACVQLVETARSHLSARGVVEDVLFVPAARVVARFHAPVANEPTPRLSAWRRVRYVFAPRASVAADHAALAIELGVRQLARTSREVAADALAGFDDALAAMAVALCASVRELAEANRHARSRAANLDADGDRAYFAAIALVDEWLARLGEMQRSCSE